MEIIPAILENDYYKVNDRLSQVVGLVDTVQLDVCDGRFTPSATWPYRKTDDNFEKIINEDESLPYWEELDFEIDLMVSDPAEVLDSWIIAGASRLIVHHESFDHNLPKTDPKSLTGFLASYRKRFPKLDGQSFDPELVLAIGTKIDPASIVEFLPDINGIQFMGIDKIGFQGQKFNPALLDKIKEFKRLHSEVPASVDGGVNQDNLASLKLAGVDRVAIGSAIFTTENVNQTIAELIQIAKS